MNAVLANGLTLVHHDDKEQSALKHYAALRGLSLNGQEVGVCGAGVCQQRLAGEIDDRVSDNHVNVLPLQHTPLTDKKGCKYSEITAIINDASLSLHVCVCARVP